MSLRVPFGLKNGRLYEPLQVPNGKLCACVCPACKKPLVAKQRASTPHFAHAQDESCAKGLETAVHLAVKQIIAERHSLRFPILRWNNPFKFQRESQTVVVEPERLCDLASVELELWLDDIRPDIVVVADGQTYLVEVAVTHFVDDKKHEKIRRKQTPTFEIDVSHLQTGFTLESLEQAIYTNRRYDAQWLYHPKLEVLTLEARQRENQRKEALAAAEQEKALKYKRYKALAPNDKLTINLRTVGISIQQMKKLSVFVPWDTSFGAPRIVWQSAVLAFIVKTQEEQDWEKYLPCSVNSSECLSWLESLFEIKPPVPDGHKIALWKYFIHLDSIKILHRLMRNDFDILIGGEEWADLPS